ncbi:MAG: hypothetical protein DI602_09985 [Aliarcobacter butzleri]|nr:MAG: hypothetical protein DI602_09985 [Aliarcobacter butzleri]
MGGVVGNINRIRISKNNIRNIFISHITEEKEVAIIIKSLIEEIFPNRTEIFVSSDGVSIAAGTKWLDEINKALHKADLLITLCSEMSIKRPWINFELGSAWIKDIRIIPVCYLGLTKNQLPQPIAMLQGMDLVDDNSLKYMFEGIAKHLGLTLGKRIDYKSMMEEVNKSFEKLECKKSSNKTENIDKSKNDSDFLSEIEINILKYFMDNENFIFIDTLYSNFNKIGKGYLEYYLNNLVENKLLFIRNIGNSTSYSITQKGRTYIIKML